MSDDSEAPEAPTPPERRAGALVGSGHGQLVLHPTRAEYPATVRALKTEGFNTCADLCAVDYLGYSAARGLPQSIEAERFEVVVNLLSHAARTRVRVRVQIAESDCRVASLYDIYPGTEAMEREAYDLFGVWFDEHPDMTRILMPDTWDGHPLRKDYATGRIPVQFKGAPQPR